MTATEPTIGVKAEIPHSLRQKIHQERWRRKYAVTSERLIVEALEFYFTEHLPVMIAGGSLPRANNT